MCIIQDSENIRGYTYFRPNQLYVVTILFPTYDKPVRNKKLKFSEPRAHVVGEGNHTSSGLNENPFTENHITGVYTMDDPTGVGKRGYKNLKRGRPYENVSCRPFVTNIVSAMKNQINIAYNPHNKKLRLK